MCSSQVKLKFIPHPSQIPCLCYTPWTVRGAVKASLYFWLNWQDLKSCQSGLQMIKWSRLFWLIMRCRYPPWSCSIIKFEIMYVLNSFVALACFSFNRNICKASPYLQHLIFSLSSKQVDLFFSLPSEKKGCECSRGTERSLWENAVEVSMHIMKIKDKLWTSFKLYLYHIHWSLLEPADNNFRVFSSLWVLKCFTTLLRSRRTMNLIRRKFYLHWSFTCKSWMGCECGWGCLFVCGLCCCCCVVFVSFMF